MPRRFRRRRVIRRKRRGGGWGRWFRKNVTPGQAASAALRGVEYLRGLVNAELFKYSQTFSAQTVTSGGAMTALHAIAQGDGDGARTGNSIFARSFNLMGRLAYTTGGNAQQTIRIAVIMDRQQVGDTAPAYTDVYSQALPWAHLNAATVGRFKVLWTRTFVVDPVGKTGLPFKINIPMRHHIRYNGTAGTDIQKGGLYLAYISDQSTANYPLLDAEYRLSYHDN